MNISELHRSIFSLRFALSVVFFARIGLFELTRDRWLDASQIEELLHIRKDKLQIVLGMLVAHGVLVEDGDRYRLNESLVPAFSEGHPDSLINLLIFDSLNVHKWVSLETNFLEEGTFSIGEISRKEIFSKAMQERVMEMHERVADVITTYTTDSVADVGCGPGSTIECVLRRNDAIRCYLIDTANVLAMTSLRFRGKYGDAENIKFVAGDVLKSALPVRARVVLASRLLMGYVDQNLAKVISNLVSALEPEGVLIINEFNPDTRVGSLMSLDAFINAGTFILHETQYAALLERHGMKLANKIRTSSFTHALCFIKDSHAGMEISNTPTS